MSLGYTLPAAGTARAFYEEFEWQIPDRYNIGAEILDETADERAVAIDHVTEAGERRSVTYGELASGTAALAAALAAAGVEAGDRVACCLPTCPEQALLHLATYRLGAVMVPLSVLLGASTTADALERTTPRYLFIDRTVAGQYPSGTFDGAARVHRVSPADGQTTDPLGGLASFVEPEETVSATPTTPDDPALIVFTSGTTGAPKGVVLPHRYLAGSLPGYHCWYQLFSRSAAADARVWTPAEWAWAGALFDVVLPTLTLGGTVVSRLRRSGFDPERAVSLIANTAVTHAFLPPTALAKLRQAGVDPDVPSLEIVMSGGENLSPSLREWTEARLSVVVNHGYGQTEANAVVGECRAAFDPVPGAMGRPYPGHSVAVLDENGTPCDPGERGELVVDLPDPVAFLRYWDAPEETATVFRDDRLHTGDRARWTEDGQLVHCGRMDDLIVTSGYRVDPFEVEHALAEHPDVSAAVVGGVPDEVRGERVKAVILLEDDRRPSDALRDEFETLVADRLGRHKVPREVEFVDRLPETRTGKTDRSALF